MARIAGVNIPTNKRVEIALTYIHGGRTTAKKITEQLGIGPEKRVQDLTDQEVLHIREAIDKDQTVEGDLRRETAMNIKRLMDLACYRGLRHRRGLPVRGQRTHPTPAPARASPSRSPARRNISKVWDFRKITSPPDGEISWHHSPSTSSGRTGLGLR